MGLTPLLCVWLLVWSSAAQAPERYPHLFLKKHIGLTDKELLLAEQGRPVVKALKTNLDREIAIFGIIWIEADADRFVASFRDIEQFERGAGVLGIKKISDPPALADFAAMTLPADDLKALRTCTLGDCPVKVDEPGLKRYQTAVDWTARDALAQANAVARQLMLETVVEYQQGGNKSLGEMRDHRRPTFVGEEFAGMLANSPYLPEYLPELHDYLKNYPSGKPGHAEEFFYWSKVNFGLHDTVRLNHVVIYRNPNATSDVAMASKMLYATHYFHTALEMRYLARDTGRPDAHGFYLMTLLRSRSDGMTGVLGGTIRGRAVKGSSEGLTKHLLAVKRSLETGR